MHAYVPTYIPTQQAYAICMYQYVRARTDGSLGGWPFGWMSGRMLPQPLGRRARKAQKPPNLEAPHLSTFWVVMLHLCSKS